MMERKSSASQKRRNNSTSSTPCSPHSSISSRSPRYSLSSTSSIRQRPRRSALPLTEPSSDDDFEFQEGENQEEEEEEEEREKKFNGIKEDLFDWTTQQSLFDISLCNREEKVQGIAVNCRRMMNQW